MRHAWPPPSAPSLAPSSDLAGECTSSLYPCRACDPCSGVQQHDHDCACVVAETWTANLKFCCGELRDSSHFVLAFVCVCVCVCEGGGGISMLDLAVSEF
jgi:hypothetical protein